MARDEERIDWQKQRAWDDLRLEHEELFTKLSAYDFDDDTQAIMDTVRNSLRNALAFVESKGPQPLPFEDLVTDSPEVVDSAEAPVDRDLPTKPMTPKGEDELEPELQFEDLLSETTDELIARKDQEWQTGRAPFPGAAPPDYDTRRQPERYPTEGYDKDLDRLTEEFQHGLDSLREAIDMMVDRMNECSQDINTTVRDMMQSPGII